MADFQWDQRCCCTNPEVETVSVKDNYRAKVYYAERDGIWYGSTDLRYGAEGRSYPLSYLVKFNSAKTKNLLLMDLWISVRDELQDMADCPKESLAHFKLVEKLLWRVRAHVRELQVGQRELFG